MINIQRAREFNQVLSGALNVFREIQLTSLFPGSESAFKQFTLDQIWRNDVEKLQLKTMPTGPLRGLSEDHLNLLTLLGPLYTSTLFLDRLKKQENPVNITTTIQVFTQVLTPVRDGLKTLVNSFIDEEITQNELLALRASLKYESDEAFSEDLARCCAMLSPEKNLRDSTRKKVGIVCGDLGTALSAINRLRETLQLTERWRELEKIEKMVGFSQRVVSNKCFNFYYHEGQIVWFLHPIDMTFIVLKANTN
eukprot:sb/3468708/